MTLGLKRDFYRRFKFVFNQLTDKSGMTAMDKNNPDSNFKSWTKTFLWVMNTFRGIKTSFLESKIK